jgi:hypothetical protein
MVALVLFLFPEQLDILNIMVTTLLPYLFGKNNNNNNNNTGCYIRASPKELKARRSIPT